MSKQKAPKGGEASTSVTNDSRFSTFTSDPKFRLPSKKHTRIQVDKRFSRMLEDDDFTHTAKVDRYGRKLSSGGKKKALEKLYQPVPPEEDEDSVDSENDIEVDDDDIVLQELERADKLATGYDAARGGGFSSSEDESDEEEEDESDNEVALRTQEQFPDMAEEQQSVPLGEVTNRIAVVNLDWDNISSSDLFAVFSSFAPAGGRILKVSVYKSEFGKERMEREEMEGPPREIFQQQPIDEQDEADSEDDETDDSEAEDAKIKEELLKPDDGKDFDSGALRQYQLERLRYYYAIVLCSDKKTARKLYESTDGTEYLNSANFLDMRFVPDDTEFDEKPRDECSHISQNYKPTEFVTDALQHSKVKLTWDAEDAGRKDAIKRAFSGSRNEISQNDLKAYLGSDSSDSEEEEKEEEEEIEAQNRNDDIENATHKPKLTKKELERKKLRAALGLKDAPTKKKEAAPVGDMEVTFTAGLAAEEEKGNVFENEPVGARQLIGETTAEAYVRKEKERKARRKAKAAAKRDGVESETVKEPEVTADTQNDLGFNDPFFASDEETKTAAAKSQKKVERQRKRQAKKLEAEERESKKAELELIMEDGNAEGLKLEHFDINEIARVEKMKKRNSKYAKKAADVLDGKRGGLQQSFEMNVTDPRFKAVLESHEYAIDPSNPKFKGTDGMKKLLEEGRRKRKVGQDEELETVPPKKSKKDISKTAKGELSSLIEKVKRTSKT